MTGATSGIGEVFAHEFASRGMSVLLISRTASKLEKVAGDIEKSTGGKVSTRILAYDFGTGDEKVTKKYYADLR